MVRKNGQCSAKGLENMSLKETNGEVKHISQLLVLSISALTNRNLDVRFKKSSATIIDSVRKVVETGGKA